MDKKEKFWNRVVTEPPEKPGSATLEIIRQTQQYLKPNDNLLDIGCGNGSITIELARSVKSVDAIDISSRSLELAKNAATARSVQNINFERATIHEISTDGQQYSAVTTFNVLQYILETEDFAKQVFDLIKPGGLFISSTPSLGHRRSILKGLLKTLSRMRIIPPVRFYSKSEFETIFEKAGFEIVDFIDIPEKKEVLLVVKTS